MENLLEICKNLATQGKIKEVADGVFFVGEIRESDPKFQEFQQKYAIAFEERRRKREAKERKAALKYWREGPWYF